MNSLTSTHEERNFKRSMGPLLVRYKVLELIDCSKRWVSAQSCEMSFVMAKQNDTILRTAVCKAAWTVLPTSPSSGLLYMSRLKDDISILPTPPGTSVHVRAKGRNTPQQIYPTSLLYLHTFFVPHGVPTHVFIATTSPFNIQQKNADHKTPSSAFTCQKFRTFSHT